MSPFHSPSQMTMPAVQVWRIRRRAAQFCMQVLQVLLYANWPADRLFQLPPRDRQFLRASHSRPEGDQRLPDGQRTELLAGCRGHLHNPIAEQRQQQQTFTWWVLGPAQILFRGVVVSVGGIYFSCQSVDCCCWCCCLVKGGGGRRGCV